MAAKAILVLCAQALIAQVAFSQCMGPAAIDGRFGGPYGPAGRDWGYDGLGLAGRGWGCGPAIDITATTGGGLPVNSASAFPPIGLTVTSENVYEGLLSAAGELPFVGTIALEGALPTAGSGAVNYGCGNGVTAMTSEAGLGAFGPAIGAFGPAGIAPGAAIAAPALGYGAGWAGRGCGCGI